MTVETALLLQSFFDVLIVGYIIFSHQSSKKEISAFVKLARTLNTLVDKQKKLLDETNTRLLEQERELGMLIDDVHRKNALLNELLSTIKSRTYKGSLRKDILLMNERGIGIEEIAKELGLTKGEVELIIKLYEEENSEKS